MFATAMKWFFCHKQLRINPLFYKENSLVSLKSLITVDEFAQAAISRDRQRGD